ncbi:MAG: thioredoxin family protein [Candidatus Hodarchaeales archaeon]|jgi:thioredoxin
MSVKKVNTVEFKELIKDDLSPLVIDMYADWCMPCRYASPQFEKLSKKFPYARFIKINVDEEPAISRSFGIRGVPSFFILKGNKILASIVGADMRKVEIKLNDVLSKKFAPFIAK